MTIELFKTLGQVNPSATSLTTLYTVPASTQTVCSSIVVCNQGVDTTFRVSVQIAGAGDDPKQYLYYDLPIEANDTFTATIGMTLATTDVVKVYAGTANVSFNLYGTEITS